jgi:hypothetical protein
MVSLAARGHQLSGAWRYSCHGPHNWEGSKELLSFTMSRWRDERGGKFSGPKGGKIERIKRYTPAPQAEMQPRRELEHVY